MGTAQAVAIVRGRLQLVVGDEIGITAYEVSTVCERIRLAASELRVTARVLVDIGVEPDGFEVLVVVSNGDGAAIPSGDAQDEVTVAILGAPDGPLTVLHTLDSNVCGSMLAEAAAFGWQQRLSETADSAEPLTASDAEVVGPIAIPGAPLLTELRAERRGQPEAAGRAPTSANTQVLTVLDDLVADLRASVRFGAAGLVDTAEDQFTKGLTTAVADGSWVQRLRLLLLAQEVAAGELVRDSRTNDDRTGTDSGHPGERILEWLDEERNATEGLTAILRDLRDRLPAEPTSQAQRLIRRKILEDTRSVRRAVDAYISVIQIPAPAAEESTTWDDALEALEQLRRRERQRSRGHSTGAGGI